MLPGLACKPLSYQVDALCRSKVEGIHPSRAFIKRSWGLSNQSNIINVILRKPCCRPEQESEPENLRRTFSRHPIIFRFILFTHLYLNFRVQAFSHTHSFTPIHETGNSPSIICCIHSLVTNNYNTFLPILLNPVHVIVW